jgi:SAM-dependent methyltransferase
MTGDDLRCHVCRGDRVAPFPEFERFHRVTSDCRPFRPGGRLIGCRDCGCVQKVVDELWRRECREIYGAYELYAQARGREQKSFDPSTGAAIARSEQLLRKALASGRLPEKGRLLDIGCGNGGLLRSASRLLPGWRLWGTELDDRHRRAIEAIPGAEGFHAGSPEGVPGRFDLISAVHVLEHLPDPCAFLERLRVKLEPSGSLFLEVPDLGSNPMDLLIADHCTSFTAESLRRAIDRAGYRPRILAADWVAKELSAIAVRNDAGAAADSPAGDPGRLVARAIDWLGRTRELARAFSGRIGVFGSSIAATWIFAELEGRVEFFVDEDPDRIGRTHLDRPILSPREVPSSAEVLIALGPALAEQVRARLGPGWHVPPPF